MGLGGVIFLFERLWLSGISPSQTGILYVKTASTHVLQGQDIRHGQTGAVWNWPCRSVWYWKVQNVWQTQLSTLIIIIVILILLLLIIIIGTTSLTSVKNKRSTEFLFYFVPFNRQRLHYLWLVLEIRRNRDVFLLVPKRLIQTERTLER